MCSRLKAVYDFYQHLVQLNREYILSCILTHSTIKALFNRYVICCFTSFNSFALPSYSQ